MDTLEPHTLELPVMGYTQELPAVLKRDPRYEEGMISGEITGTWNGMHVINSRSKKIIDGVYMCAIEGKPIGEAIAVKDDRDLKFVYDSFARSLMPKFKDLLSRPTPIPGISLEETVVLISSLESARNWIPYDFDKAEGIYETYANEQGTHSWPVIPLSAYIIGQNPNKGGVCRHQTLLAMAMLQKDLEDPKGLLPKNAGIRVLRNFDDYYGYGHSWGLYISPNGTKIVIDPANDYVGPMQGPDIKWLYTEN